MPTSCNIVLLVPSTSPFAFASCQKAACNRCWDFPLEKGKEGFSNKEKYDTNKNRRLGWKIKKKKKVVQLRRVLHEQISKSLANAN